MKNLQSTFLALTTILMAPVLSVPTLQLEHSQAVLFKNISHAVAASDSGSLLPVENPIPSYWLVNPEDNPLAKEGSKGELTDEADVCIIGSGITGASAAYHLSRLSSKSQVKAVVLEARDFCSGATGRNGGHLHPNLFHDFVLRQTLYGTEQAVKTFDLEQYTVKELLSIISERQLADKIDLVRADHNTVFVTKDEEAIVKADWKAAIEAGVDLDDVQWTSAEEMEKKYGVPFPASSFPGYNLWPLKLVTEIYKLAKEASSHFQLTLHTHTPVVSISQAGHEQNGKKWILHTPRGEVRCNYVIHATNAYANHLIPRSFPSADGSSPALELVVTPTRGQVMALRAGANQTRITKASWGANEGFEYWFPRPVKDGDDENPLIIIGGGREAAPGFEVGVFDDSSKSSEVSKSLKDFLPSLFTGTQEGEEIYVKGREPEQEWTGIMGFTRTGDPFVGPVPGYDGQYISAGYSGHGMPRGYAGAEVVARMVHSKLTGEALDLPDWLPKHYLTTP